MIQKALEAITTSWKESLTFFYPSTLGRFLLLSLRTLIQIYTAVPFAWFFPTALFAGVLFADLRLIVAFYIIFITRAARPSIEYKKALYWDYFTPADWILFAFIYLYQHLPVLAGFNTSKIALGFYYLLGKIFLLEGYFFLSRSSHYAAFLLPFISPFIIIWALFMLDSQKTVFNYIKSFFRAIAMFVYNFPFFALCDLTMRLIIAGGSLLSGFTNAPLGWIILFGLVVPYYIAFITNFYVKRLHDQFNLYYKA